MSGVFQQRYLALFQVTVRSLKFAGPEQATAASTENSKTIPELFIFFWTNNFILGNASIHCTFSHCGI